ncbi:MAG: iron-containing alcohol dehydrogenase [Gammaproteobacteria bacterium]|nr:iron-containing alcohol dehydrogenase [Gammaproteobacteria bacterium]NIY30936.1 iron-containing alcohol dehydrogenase [Gammaproteobacteria bacterium]
MALPGHDFDDLYGATGALLDELDIPSDLGALGVGEEQVAEIARKAYDDPACGTNPAPATIDQIETLLRQAIIKAR